MTPAEIDALPEFTTAQRLKLVRWKIQQVIASAAQYGINGRSLMNHDLEKLRAEETALENQVAVQEASESGGGDVIVRIGERV